MVAFLDTLGLRPGVRVLVKEKHPFDGPLVLVVDGEDRTVGEKVARQIYVRKEATKSRKKERKGVGMNHLLLAAEGGYQEFHLGGTEWFWLIASAGTAVLALLVGFVLRRGVLAADAGTEKMQEIAGAIEEGAMAYLRRQFRTIAMILIPLVVVVFFTATAVDRADGTEALSFVQSGIFRTLAFVAGAILSGLTGFIGMSLAVKGNVRTAAAAKTGSLPDALRVAFRTGGVAGMYTVGLGLLGASVIIMLFQNTASAILIGFGFGGSLIALFIRVGGGIFTKAADVGADLVGKVEAGIPEDDPRNAADHRRQRGRQRGRLRRYGRRPVRELRSNAGGVDHPRRRRVRVDRLEPRSRAHLPGDRPRPSACWHRSSASSRCAPPTKTSRPWRRSTAGSSPRAS